ncbi:hypothetical protein BpHYR1_037769 [Brachionus plicatilis]|uniref:Uncharacterized protein n=1 Tax=Brachionus plicatilis TaxID=10195 RepID=A0A3M7RA63_BRAPC|nr:hypothetical protein BpHYR1_037769 [Brachionus plicatilis]
MVSMVLVLYGMNPNFDIVPRVMVTSLRYLKPEQESSLFIDYKIKNGKRMFVLVDWSANDGLKYRLVKKEEKMKKERE